MRLKFFAAYNKPSLHLYLHESTSSGALVVQIHSADMNYTPKFGNEQFSVAVAVRNFGFHYGSGVEVKIRNHSFSSTKYLEIEIL